MLTRGRSRHQDGAVALIVAICSLALFGFAAIAVDLGNGFVRKRDVQSQADFAALAAGAKLPKETGDATDPAVIAAADFLNKNQAQDDDLAAECANDASQCVDAGDLVDGDYTNGEAVFGDFGRRLQVFAPRARVNFGLAGALGFENVDVQADATVGIFSPAKALPYFVSLQCSWGSQTVVDPAPGQQQNNQVPNLVPASSNWNVNFTTNQTQVPLNTGTLTLTITSTGPGANPLATVDKIGFTTSSGSHVEAVPATKTGSQITVAVPATVLTTQNIWYVRPHEPLTTDPAGRWSRDASVLQVGNPPLYVSSCGSAADSGNFGSLRLSRNDSTNSDWVAMNTALGIQHDLGPYPLPPSGNYPEPCGGQPDAVLAPDPWVAGPRANCLVTDPGLVQPLTRGLITGVNGRKGLLDVAGDPDKNTTCNASGNTNNRGPINIAGAPSGPYYINNDVLSCFFTNDTVTVGAVSSETYAGPTVISKDIFASPRYFYLPVLSIEPTSGTSSSYAIVTFRAAFITGQPDTATRANKEPTVTNANGNENGVVTDNNGIDKLNIRLINNAALPETSEIVDGVIPYLGSGTKIVRLVD